MGAKRPRAIFWKGTMALEACYYGDRKVIYVQIRYPDQKRGSKLVSVYGHSFKEVLRAIDQGLTTAFGKVGAKRPTGGRGRARTRVY